MSYTYSYTVHIKKRTSFFVGITCWDDNVSKEPSPEKMTQELVYQHIPIVMIFKSWTSQKALKILFDIWLSDPKNKTKPQNKTNQNVKSMTSECSNTSLYGRRHGFYLFSYDSYNHMTLHLDMTTFVKKQGE